MRLTCARRMRRCFTVAAVVAAASLASATTTDSHTTPSPKPPVHHHATSRHASAKGTSAKGKKSKKTAAAGKRGQQKIDPERTQQIQEALIREHYLTGKSTGSWDAATQQAMQKYQEDNGWQSKTTPDSRALIKLGLGPDQQHLLNPESAMTSSPQSTSVSSKGTDRGDPRP